MKFSMISGAGRDSGIYPMCSGVGRRRHNTRQAEDRMEQTTGCLLPRDAPAAPDDDWRFHPKHPVEQDSVTGEWIVHLPNSDLRFLTPPQWLCLPMELNEVLDEAQDPLALRRLYDHILSLAEKNIDTMALAKLINGSKDLDLLQGAQRLFKLHLRYEMNSTEQVGGAMAGSLCNMMRKYQIIVGLLNRRLS